MKKQLFGFNRNIRDILSICDSKPAHVYWKDVNSSYIGCNDIQTGFLRKSFGAINFVGKPCFDVFPSKWLQDISANDKTVFHNKKTMFFVEGASLRECLSLKTVLEDSSSNVIGTIGISFYLDEISLSEALSVINQLGLTPEYTLLYSKILLHNAIKDNLFILSRREKECVCCIIKGMSTKKIAATLNISPRTVESHIDHIKTKMNCNTRLQIINKSLEQLLS